MKVWVLALLLISAPNLFGAEILLPKSVYRPLFKDPGETDTNVGPILIDKTPVTNQEFLEYIKKHLNFSKSKVPALFADSGYLSHWTSDLKFPKSQAQFPVTHVSWFIARKFCESQGKRLPSIAEWEVASDAQNPVNEAKILEWYGKPDLQVRNVGIEPPNRFGISDMNGLIWEWVENFSEAIMSGDSRGGSPTESLFCGGAALKAKDPTLYATFLRFAFRSSLTAQYTSSNLGFRCVKNLTGVSK